MSLTEWPDGTRIEVPGDPGVSLYYRDDTHAADEFRHWWGMAACSASTWAELVTRHGETAVAAAMPLYRPDETRPASVRPVHVVLGTENGEPYVWCFTDADDARDAYARGCGERILSAVILGPGVPPQVLCIYTGWARIGRDDEGDYPPGIVRQIDTWLAPGVEVETVATGGDQPGSVATVGIDVLDIFATGPSRDAVLFNLDARYESLKASRASAVEWHAAPTAILR